MQMPSEPTVIVCMHLSILAVPRTPSHHSYKLAAGVSGEPAVVPVAAFDLAISCCLAAAAASTVFSSAQMQQSCHQERGEKLPSLVSLSCLVAPCGYLPDPM